MTTNKINKQTLSSLAKALIKRAKDAHTSAYANLAIAEGATYGIAVYGSTDAEIERGVAYAQAYAKKHLGCELADQGERAVMTFYIGETLLWAKGEEPADARKVRVLLAA